MRQQEKLQKKRAFVCVFCSLVLWSSGVVAQNYESRGSVDSRELMRRIKNNTYVTPKVSARSQQMSRRVRNFTRDNRWYFNPKLPVTSASTGRSASRMMKRPKVPSNEWIIGKQAYRISRLKPPVLTPPNDENSRNVARFLIPARPKLNARGSAISQQIMKAAHPPAKVISSDADSIGRNALKFRK